MSYTLTEFLKFIKTTFGQYELAKNEKNVAIKCPECKDKKNSLKKKLVIQTIDNRVHCWRCGYKARSLIHLLKKHGTQGQLQTYLEKFYTGKRYLPFEQIEEKITIELPEDFRLLLTSKKNDPKFLRALTYLSKRDLSIDDVWKWKMGLSDDLRWNNRIIIPSFNTHGKLNDFVGRSLDPNAYIKYDSPNPDKLSVIFNELNIDWKNRLVLCEGVFDAMKCGNNVVPLLGSELNEESYLFEQIVINQTPIAMALDQDTLLTKTPKIIHKLQEFNIDVILVRLTKPDPGSMSKQEFQDALGIATNFEWKDDLINRLNALNIRL